ncbi:40433_t:CDS:1, partial [Gigaspora margarita]
NAIIEKNLFFAEIEEGIINDDIPYDLSFENEDSRLVDVKEIRSKQEY